MKPLYLSPPPPLLTPAGLPMVLFSGKPSLAGGQELVISDPKKRALQLALRQHAGYSFLELMLGIGAATVIGGVAFALYIRSDVQANVRQEQANINDITAAAERAFGKVGSFGGLDNATLIEEGLVPGNMVAGSDLRSAWGRGVTVEPETINGDANAGLRISYAQVPAESCSKLASAIVGSMFDIEVDGVSVLSARGEIDPKEVASRCGADNAADMSFVYYNGARGALAIAPPLTLPCPPPETRTGTCPPGEFGTIRERRHPVCDASGVHTGWGAWTEFYNTCDPNVDCEAAGTCPPIVPPPPPPPCEAPDPQTKNLGCPPGQVGAHIQQRVATCPAPTGPYTWGSWTTISNTCAPAAGCPAPQTQAASCPPGSIGSRTQQRDCTDPGPPVSWGAWYDVANSCQDEETTPPPIDPTPYTPCVPLASQTRQVNCPSPQLGRINEQRDSFCSASYNVSPQWTGWYETSNTCYPCPPTGTQTRTVSRDTCPTSPPWFGATTQTQSQQRTQTYTCPAAAGPAVANPWSGWEATSPWTPAPNPAGVAACYQCPSPESQPRACPPGQTGSITETRTANCTENGWSWGGWVETSNTCAPMDCPMPEPARQWRTISSPITCPSGNPGTRTCDIYRDPVCSGAPSWTWGYPPSWTYSTPVSLCPTDCGSATPSCGPAPATPSCPSGWTNTYAYVAAPAPTCWTLTGSCTAPPPPSCPTAPAPGSRTMSCPAGTIGSWTQTHGWNAAPAPTCWTAAPWMPASAPPGACVAPPPPSTHWFQTGYNIGNEGNCGAGSNSGDVSISYGWSVKSDRGGGGCDRSGSGIIYWEYGDGCAGLGEPGMGLSIYGSPTVACDVGDRVSYSECQGGSSHVQYEVEWECRI